MTLTWDVIQSRAIAFVQQWQGGGKEKREAQSFVRAFLGVFGVDAADEQKAAIEKLARGILDARALFPGSSLADLYGPLTMPPELLKAHQALDRTVMKLYEFPVKDTTEVSCVAALMERYQILAKGH